MQVDATRRATSAWLASALLAGCGTLPVGAFVPDRTIETLETTEFVEEVDPAAIARGMRATLGYRGGPDRLGRALYHRVDLGLGPVAPCRLDRADAPSVAGLRSGDILLAKNGKAQSLGTTLTLEGFSLYDHLGLLAIEEGRPYVYESWATVSLLRPAPDFAARFRGTVARVPLSRFVQRYETIEAIRLPLGDRVGPLLRGARASLDENIHFDPHHDPADPRLSCSEYMVYLLGEKAGYEPELERLGVSTKPSVRRLLASLGFRVESYLTPGALALVPGTVSVGILSRHDRSAKVLGTRCAYEVLHEHFQDHAEIGSYIRFDNWQLSRFRINVRAFIEWSRGYAGSLVDPEAEDLRADLTRVLPLFFRGRGDRGEG